MNVALTPVSRNSKTGPIATSTTSAESCPPSCPFNNGGGCYASVGPQAMWWRRVTKGVYGTNWNEFCNQVANLPFRTMFRHNVSGDLPGVGEKIDGGLLRQLTRAVKGKLAFAYTHKYMLKGNLKLIREANKNGFVINLSANSMAHADKLVRAKAGPVVCVLPDTVNPEATPSLLTPEGNKVVVCPSQYRANVTCQSCQLCAKQRSVIVGFIAHGAKHKSVSQIASAA